MTNGYNRNYSNLTNTMEHANALIQRGLMSRNKTERMERVYWPPGNTGAGFGQVYRRQKQCTESHVVGRQA